MEAYNTIVPISVDGVKLISSLAVLNQVIEEVEDLCEEN